MTSDEYGGYSLCESCRYWPSCSMTEVLSYGSGCRFYTKLSNRGYIKTSEEKLGPRWKHEISNAIRKDGTIMEKTQLVSNVRVYGLEESIRRAKFPMSTDTASLNTELTDGIKALAQSDHGRGHDQWLTGVIVQFDLTFSNKAWGELERYHFIDFVSSQSTMHRITRFDLDKAYNEYVDPRIVSIMKEMVAEYNTLTGPEQKQKYLEILYSNPAGFRLTAGLTTNYRQLKTIYAQRRNHRLPEWREFCAWIETLPHSELIVDCNQKQM